MYFASKFPAKLSDASCARLVEINATRAPAGKTERCRSKLFPLASVGPPPLPMAASVGPPLVGHSLLWGCRAIANEVGGGGNDADLSAELGKIGGAAGGGGTGEEPDEAPASVGPLPLVALRVIRVRVCSGLEGAPSNSQIGNTMCPDGARSSWNTSVPGGRFRSRSYSPGPTKYNFMFWKSQMALLSSNDWLPNKPGMSEL